MDDRECLNLLLEITENTRKTTEEHPYSFFSTYISFATDINRISRHIDNLGLRKVYFHLGTLQTPLEESMNYQLQNELLDELEGRDIDTVGIEELIRDAATSVTVRSISDLDGRETIDMNQLRSNLQQHTADVDEEASSLITFNIGKALKNIQPTFVEEKSQKMIDLYRDIENACHSDWDEVMRVISSKTVEADDQAISWKRADSL